MRRLGAGQLVAFGTAAAYLLSPTVIGLRGFGGTFFGFLLLPTYAYIDLWVMGVLDRRRGPALALAVIGYAAVKTGAVFMDGYSFIAANLVSTGLWVAWLLEARKPLRRRLAGVVLLVGANALALATYLLYVPGSYEENPIGVFRSMGLDVVTLLVPTDVVWLAASLGVAREHSDLWGDGSNSAFNYVGLVWVGLVIAYLARPPRRRPAIALGAAGLIAFVLALGPSLKVNEINRKPVSIPTYESYLMPEGTAAADFPWAGLYTTLPGVDSMRASYRWFGVTRLALVVLAGLAVAQLAARSGRGRILAALLAGIAVVEIAPNLPIYMDSYRRNDRSVEQFSHSVEADLRAVTRPGERTFFLNYDDSHNDYLANYLAAAADLRSFNAGGDKNAILARAGWPAEVVALAESPTGDEVVTALGSGQVDVVVVPYFHLRLSSYAWPPAPEVQAQARAAFASLVLDQRLHAVRRHWFTVLRLGAG
jgi:FtsH-binding integral membrane protein